MSDKNRVGDRKELKKMYLNISISNVQSVYFQAVIKIVVNSGGSSYMSYNQTRSVCTSGFPC